MTSSCPRRICALLLGSSFLLVAAIANAESKLYHARFTGSASPTGVDTNGDGEAATPGASQGRSNLGAFTTQSWDELLPWDGQTFCGPTHVQLQYRFFELLQTFADGSRLFSQLTSGTLCFDFTTGAAEADIDSEVVGGSGRFAGASGQLSTRAQLDHAFPNGLAAFSGESRGTITLP